MEYEKVEVISSYTLSLFDAFINFLLLRVTFQRNVDD